MKYLLLSKFHQVYSRASGERPSSVWAINLESEGVMADMIELSSNTSTGWTGWGFQIFKNDQDYTTACLLFENREDAVMIKLLYGEKLYAN